MSIVIVSLFVDWDSWENSLGQFHETFVNVNSGFGGGFQKFHTESFGEFFTLLITDLSIVFEIALVTNQDLSNVWTSVGLDFVQPVLDILETLSIGDVINQNDSISSFIVSGGNGFESFLPGGIPDMELDGLVVALYVSNLEINSNGWEERLVEQVIRESEENVGFSDGGVSDKENLEQVIVFLTQ